MYFSRIRIRQDIFKNTQLTNVIYDNIYSKHQLFWDLFPGQKSRNFLFREEIAREQMGSRPGFRGEPIYYLVSKTTPSADNPLFYVETKNYQPQFTSGERLKFELRVNPVVTKNGKKHDVVMNSQRIFLESLCSYLNLNSHLPSKVGKGDLKKVLLIHGGEPLDKRLTVILESNFRYADCLNQTISLSKKLEWTIKSVIDTALEQWLTRQGQDKEVDRFRILKDRNGQLKLQNSAYQWHDLMQKSRKGNKSGFSSVDFTGDLEIIDPEAFKTLLFNGIGRSKAFGCGLMLVKRI